MKFAGYVCCFDNSSPESNSNGVRGKGGLLWESEA